VLVGEVIDRVITSQGVRLTLGLYPEQREVVPAGVTARILPKTLFGAKYVALQAPAAPAAVPIEPGAVIEEADVAIEIERVLEDIYPLLRTVQPAQLNYTLTALATALEGRGDELGESLSTLEDYLARVNPRLPALVEDLRLLSDVSDVYRRVMPEVARLLRNGVTTGQTLLDKEAKVEALFLDAAGLSSTARGFLETNGDAMVRLAELGEQTLPLLEKYAPEYPCLLDGIVKIAPRQAEAFRGHTLHINLETLPNQPRGYGPQDDPVYGDKRGPHSEELCRRAISGEWGQHNLPPDFLVPDLVDGVDEPTGKRRAAPGVSGAAAPAGRVGEMPDVAALLLGPLAGRKGVGPR
jgi:phospholipid/cholesterol/gamma-HCH transport system substrate-binding protein